MTELLIHPTSQTQLQAAQDGSHHALLIVGSRGMGKSSVARWHACQLLGIETLDTYPYVFECGADDEVVGIEQIRALKESLKRKTTGTGTIRRVCLVHGADTMTAEAANALLKALEEPPEDTVLILTATQESGVPQTIRSRSQIVSLLPVDETTASEYFGNRGHASKDTQQAYRISGGRPALMHALLSDADHPLVDAIGQAKQLLAADVHTRLLRVEPLAKDKPAVDMLLFGLERICSSLLQSTAEQGGTKLARMHHVQEMVINTRAALTRNANTKLLLTNLMLNM